MNALSIYRDARRRAAALLLLMLPLAAGAALPAAARNKLDARLAAVAVAAAGNRTAPLMASAISREIFRQNSPAEVRWNAAAQVQVYLHYARAGTAPGGAALAALGASDVVGSRALGVVQAWIPASALTAAAALPEVTRISVPRYAFVKRAPAATLPRTGTVDTQGDQLLGAAQFRGASGYTGQGIVVGVISDGDSGVSTDQASGDLPANVWDDPNNAGSFKSSGAEGTAMMEIVYDLAPGVKQLGFCGPQTTLDFLTCLNDFAKDINANVIVDDLGFPGEAMFTDGNFATAVKQFAQNHPNIRLVSAAGNDATAFWAGGWNAMTLGTPVTVNGVTYTTALNFAASGPANPDMTFTVQPGDTVTYILEWDDPWNDASTTNDPNGDYDVVLFDSGNNPIACNQGMNINTSNGKCSYTTTLPLDTPGPQPVQGSQWQNTGTTTASVHLEIFLVKGTPGPNPGDLGNNLKILFASQKSNQIQISPNTPAGSTFGQSAVASPLEITVGAVPAGNPGQIETYSSQGPVLLGIPGTGTGTQPAESRPKPDFVAPDCVSVTGVGGFGSPFCGTSAAAPHIAGLMALLLSAYPGDDPYVLLQNSATPLGVQPPPNGVYGFGLPDLPALLSSGKYPATGAVIASPVNGASIYSGQATSFAASCLGYSASGGFTYLWNFGTAAIPDSSSPTPNVTYTTSGTYTVTLTCSNTVGSGSTSSVITVTNPPSKGGGGSFGLLALAALLTAAVAARRRR
ncbi:MAG: S8 family serine peptidase [Gammaproteobacteria bacterium]|nr:S8 family serine peptidase [Gammaproteobacteria bacterium]